MKSNYCHVGHKEMMDMLRNCGFLSRIFPGVAGEAGLNNFLLRAFRDFFIPDLEESHPRNASGMSFLGVEIVDITIHKIPSLRFGCGKNKLPSFLDPRHVISPGGSGYSCFKYCLIASSFLRNQQRKNMSPAFHKKLRKSSSNRKFENC